MQGNSDLQSLQTLLTLWVVGKINYYVSETEAVNDRLDAV